MPNDRLNEYGDAKRLAVHKMLLAACGHLYSKGALQEERFRDASAVFADLAKNDPLFLAHFAAWAARGDNKDQKVLSVFFNAISDADGLPFFKGSELSKPNLRRVSHALLQRMDVPLVLRVAELAQTKFGVAGLLNESRHFPTALKTAIRKYLLYREANQHMLRGIRNARLTGKYCSLYRAAGIQPSDYVVGLFKWNQKDGRRWKDLQVAEDSMPDFERLTPKDIVEVLGKVRLAPMVALSVIPREKITSAVAAALLQNCSGNQAVVLYNWFAENGFLDVKAIRTLFKDKVSGATTAVDRIDTLTRDSAAEDKEMMSDVRSAARKAKADTGKFGKVFMHIDVSGSMDSAIAFAKDKASIFAECIDEPARNFGWAAFNTARVALPVPQSFKREGFHAALYGLRAGGGTDCYATYEEAANPGVRGGKCGKGVRPGHFDVAVAPSDLTPDAMRTAFVAVLIEKAYNDIVAYEELLKAMVADGKVTQGFADSAKATTDDVGAGFLSPRLALPSREERGMTWQDIEAVRKDRSRRILEFARSVRGEKEAR
jgi:hypothetical protein